MSARRTANRATDPGPVPAGELALVQRVRLAGQAAVSGKSDPFSVGEAGLDCGGAAVGATVVIGHFPAGLEPGRWGSPGPAVQRKPNLSRPAWSCYAADQHKACQPDQPRNAPYRFGACEIGPEERAHIVQIALYPGGNARPNHATDQSEQCVRSP
ncbi:MAG: hypothetical protein WBW33_22925 [Bryobacteraceae bacterium]